MCRTYRAWLLVIVSCLLASCAEVAEQGAKKVAEEAIEPAAESVEKKVGPELERALSGIKEALERPKSVVGEAAERQIVSSLSPEERPIFEAIETIHPRLRWRRMVSSDGREFVRAFEEGAHNPDQYFNDPTVEPAVKSAIDTWNRAAKGDRVFVIGSGEDRE
jgi:hypothetical protein